MSNLTVSVPIIDDDSKEDEEVFYGNLRLPPNSSSIELSPGRIKATILDNDRKPLHDHLPTYKYNPPLHDYLPTYKYNPPLHDHLPTYQLMAQYSMPIIISAWDDTKLHFLSSLVVAVIGFVDTMYDTICCRGHHWFHVRSSIC